MKNIAKPTSIFLFLIFFMAGTINALSQYEIKTIDGAHQLLKKGKVQKTTVTKHTYFQVDKRENVFYHLKDKKKEGFAYKSTDTTGWIVEWFDEVIIPDEELYYSTVINGFIKVRNKEQYGMYSYNLNRMFLDIIYDSIVDPTEDEYWFKVYKEGDFAVFRAELPYREDISSKLYFSPINELFNRIATEEYAFFGYGSTIHYYVMKVADGNGYNLFCNYIKEYYGKDDRKHEIVFEKLLAQSYEAIYDWPIAKRDGKFGFYRISDIHDIPPDEQFYANQYDTLYYVAQDIIVGKQNGKFTFFRQALKDSTQTYLPYDYFYLQSIDPTGYLMHLHDKLLVFEPVVDPIYDEIFYDNEANTLVLKKDGLYGICSLKELPSKSIRQEVSCYNSSSNRADLLMNHHLIDSTNKIEHYQLFSKYEGQSEYENRSKLAIVNYGGYSSLIYEDYDTAFIVCNVTGMKEMPNHTYLFENDGYIFIANFVETYNKRFEFLKNFALELAAKSENALYRDTPPESYFEGYQPIKLTLKNETVTVMMDKIGREYVVTDAFLKKYPKLEDRREFIGTQTFLSDYLK